MWAKIKSLFGYNAQTQMSNADMVLFYSKTTGQYVAMSALASYLLFKAMKGK